MYCGFSVNTRVTYRINRIEEVIIENSNFMQMTSTRWNKSNSYNKFDTI